MSMSASLCMYSRRIRIVSAVERLDPLDTQLRRTVLEGLDTDGVCDMHERVSVTEGTWKGRGEFHVGRPRVRACCACVPVSRWGSGEASAL